MAYFPGSTSGVGCCPGSSRNPIRRCEDSDVARRRASWHPAAHLVETWLVAPLALLSLATGIGLALLTGRGLLRQPWVAAKLAVTAVLAGVVLFVLRPRLAASAEAAIAGETFTAAQALPLAIAPAAAVALLTFNVFLGVYQPRWRARAGVRGPGRPSRADAGVTAR